MNLEARIELLERRCRRMMVVGGLAIALGVAGMMAGLTRSDKPADITAGNITARGISLSDGKGASIVLSVLDGKPTMELTTDGVHGITAVAEKNVSYLAIKSPAGATVASAGRYQGGREAAAMMVTSSDGKRSALVMAPAELEPAGFMINHNGRIHEIR